jgi:putative transposase
VTDVVSNQDSPVDLDAAPPAQPLLSEASNDELVRLLAERARAQGLKLAGEGGLLAHLTKRVVESALEGELDDHLGYGKHDPVGRGSGNSRNGSRAKTVVTEAGPVDIEVPRDRAGSFEPQIIKKRQRRLSGVEDLVISLSAKGLTHGEISAHLAEVYGAAVSKQTISTITDRVLEGMAEWQSRPLDPVYPVIFIDAVNVKIRDGNVANRPIYLALAVTVEGTRDILGLWAGEHGDGEGEVLGAGALGDQKPWHTGCLHGGVRWAQGPAGCDRNRLAAGDHPDVCRAPSEELVSLRLQEGLAGAGP